MRNERKLIIVLTISWMLFLASIVEIELHRTQIEYKYIHDDFSLPEQKPQIYITSYFSRQDNVTEIIINTIDKANESIYMMMYSFTLRSVAEKLVEKHEQGIGVYVILEPTQISNYSQCNYLNSSGVFVFVDNHTGLMHHKVIIIDGKIVICGSYNLSNNAEKKNSEDIILVRDENGEISQRFIQEFNRIVYTGSG